jgi:hypothetical protein
MLSRRELLGAGVAAGVATNRTAVAAPAMAGQPAEVAALGEIAEAVEAVDRTLDKALLSNDIAFGSIARLRATFESYFRTTQRFPEFIDIGLGVFMEVYDWHIKYQQQLMITRGADARYWIRFMFTTLVLRGEQDANFIGVPYEKV